MCLDNAQIKYLTTKQQYRKPSNISLGLVFIRKPFLMGLYADGLYMRGGGGGCLYTDCILC